MRHYGTRVVTSRRRWYDQEFFLHEAYPYLKGNVMQRKKKIEWVGKEEGKVHFFGVYATCDMPFGGSDTLMTSDERQMGRGFDRSRVV